MGGETARALLEAGAHLGIIDRTDELVAEAREELGSRELVGASADVTNAGEVVHALNGVIGRLGGIDILVNVAGGTTPASWGPLTDESSGPAFDAMISLNLRYVMEASVQAARHMMTSGGGAIVNFASISALASAPFHAAYGAAKAGLMAMTRTMAVEWAEHSIRVNCVAPGAVASPRTAGTALNVADDAVARFLSPSEVAAVVLFLCTPLSQGINGQTISVDGGASARSPLGTVDSYAESARKRRAQATAAQVEA